jgi:Mn-dependent DtxR family transcriptional regulator
LLENKRDSRQVPKTKQICTNKKYYDILYAYLQCISSYDENTNERSFPKKEINFSTLASMFNMSRQTVSKKFNNLIELGLVVAKDANTYLLTELEADIAALVPYKTLKLVTDTLNEHSINTYVYLLNRYYANQCKSFQFTLAQVKEYIGICATTRSNDDTVTNILFVLQKLGLIRYRLTVVEQKDNFNNIKTIYELEWLTNEIK